MISFIYCNTSSIKLSPIKKLSFEQEYNMINNMFPSIKFSICMNLDKINTSLCNDEFLYIINNHSCYCFENKNMQIISIHNKEKRIFTIYDILKQLEFQEFNPECDHIFLEDIIHKKDNMYELEFML